MKLNIHERYSSIGKSFFPIKNMMETNMIMISIGTTSYLMTHGNISMHG